MKTLRHIVSAALCLSLTATAVAQEKLSGNDAKLYEQALKLAGKTNNRVAIGLLRELHEKHPDNIDISYNLGICYINGSGNPDSARYFLKRVADFDSNEKWSESRMELAYAMARAEQLCNNPSGAKAIYEEMKKHDTTGEWAKEISEEEKHIENATALMAQPVKLVLRAISSNVNSQWNDYRPVLTLNEDTMYFTSRRPKKNADETVLFDDGQFEEGIYRTIRTGSKWNGDSWSKAEPVTGLVVDNDGFSGQETATCISPDGTELYFCHDGNIYVSKRGEDGKWQKGVKLPEPINSAYNEYFAYVTHDNQTMFISSDAPGGFGGRDIYRSRRLPNGEWGEPLNLGPGVNTPGDEDAPFFHEETGFLYFSSTGHNSMGGYDIFYALEDEDGKFVAAQNLGFPINSADDDLFFTPSSDRDRAYFATIRWKESDAPSYDIYEVEYDQPEHKTTVVIEGKVVGADLANTRIYVFENGERTGVIRPNLRTGKFVTMGKAGESFEVMAVCGNDTIRASVKTEKADSYHANHHALTLDDFVFSKKSEQSNDNAASQENPQKAKIKRNPDSPWASKLTTPDKPYTVQFMSLRRQLRPDQLRGDLEPDSVAEYIYKTGWFVYTYSCYATYAEAKAAQERIRRTTPYRDAFGRNSKQYEKFIKQSYLEMRRRETEVATDKLT